MAGDISLRPPPDPNPPLPPDLSLDHFPLLSSSSSKSPVHSTIPNPSSKTYTPIFKTASTSTSQKKALPQKTILLDPETTTIHPQIQTSSGITGTTTKQPVTKATPHQTESLSPPVQQVNPPITASTPQIENPNPNPTSSTTPQTPDPNPSCSTFTKPTQKAPPILKTPPATSGQGPSTEPTWAARLKSSTDKKLHSHTSPSFNEAGIPRIKIPDSVFKKGADIHKDYVLGVFTGLAPPFSQIQSVLTHVWGKGSKMEIHLRPDSRSMLVRIPNASIRQKVVEQEIWHIGNSLFYVADRW